MLELDACILGGKAPVDPDSFLIASLLPDRHFLCELRLRADALAQAILAKDGKFDLGHVEPGFHVWECSGFPASRPVDGPLLGERPHTRRQAYGYSNYPAPTRSSGRWNTAHRRGRG